MLFICQQALQPTFVSFQIYDNAESTRPKKWSSRLKLNTSGSIKSPEKSPESPYGMYGTISAPGGSALSKSMKYAETWLYGSVRTQTPPMRPSVFSAYPEVSSPVLISTPQKPTPHNYAVILCSCPEYLNGTKKSSSTKVSICKKCKGSRLPLTIADSPRMLVGGTVRGPQISRDAGMLGRAGTVRVQSSKSRPSILKQNEADPYDLMRRSRLAPPHDARIGSQFATSRSRAKSISPCRPKTRRPSPETLRKNRSKSVARVNNIWVEEDVTSNESKKSILSCDINPYDLVKSNSQSLVEIEFDDHYGDVLNEALKKENSRTSKQKSDNNVKNISGQRVRIVNDSQSSPGQAVSIYDTVKVNYDLSHYELKPEDNTSLLPNIKNENKKFASLSKNTSKKVFNPTNANRTKQKSVSPKRPPRRARNVKTDDDSESDNQITSDRNYNRKSNEASRSPKYRHQNTDNIKSILKKPRSFETTETSKSQPTTYAFEGKRFNTSHFYLPKPYEKKIPATTNAILQRKRVQFLVENEETKVIYTAEFNLQENTVRGIPGDVIIEPEEDIVAEGDVVSHSLTDGDNVEISNIINQETNNDSGVYEDVHIAVIEAIIDENAKHDCSSPIAAETKENLPCANG